MKTKTYFAFRIDVWDSASNSLTEPLAGVEDYAMAVAACWLRSRAGRWTRSRCAKARGW